jgi:hypothetical protein
MTKVLSSQGKDAFTGRQSNIEFALFIEGKRSFL